MPDHRATMSGERDWAADESPLPGSTCGVCGQPATRSVLVTRPTRYVVHRCDEHWTAAPYRAEDERDRAVEALREIQGEVRRAVKDEESLWKLRTYIDTLARSTLAFLDHNGDPDA